MTGSLAGTIQILPTYGYRVFGIILFRKRNSNRVWKDGFNIYRVKDDIKGASNAVKEVVGELETVFV